jgi:hypothetical protein
VASSIRTRRLKSLVAGLASQSAATTEATLTRMATRAIAKTRRRPLGAVRRLGRPFPFACLDDSLPVAVVRVTIGVLNPIVDVTPAARSLEQRMRTGYAAFL